MLIPWPMVTDVMVLALVPDLPPSPDFSFTYRPTPVTLFRFSALTFNAHHIHLDKEYASQVEGYPGALFDFSVAKPKRLNIKQNVSSMVH